jgi:hypothetical protein
MTTKKKSMPLYIIYDQFENHIHQHFATEEEAILVLSEMDNPTKKFGSKTFKRYVVKEF